MNIHLPNSAVSEAGYVRRHTSSHTCTCVRTDTHLYVRTQTQTQSNVHYVVAFYDAFANMEDTHFLCGVVTSRTHTKRTHTRVYVRTQTQTQSNVHYVVAFYDAFANMEDATVSLMVEFMDGGSLQDIVDTVGG